MSETISYRLSAPSAKAYEPSPLEVAYAQMLPRSGTVPTIGYQYAAEVDARNARNDYTLALNEFNQRAMEAGNRAEANANLRDRMRMLGAFANNPESAALYSLTQSELAPNARETGAQYTLAGLDYLRSRAARNFADAANSGTSGTPDPMRQQRGDERIFADAERFAQAEGNNAARRAADGLNIRLIPGTDIPAGRGPLTPEERAQIESARNSAIASGRESYLARVAPRLRGGPSAQQPAQQTPAPTPQPTTEETTTVPRDESAAAVPAPASTQASPPLTARGQRAQQQVPGYSPQTHKLVAGPNNTVQVVERNSNRVVGTFPDPGQ